MDPQMKPIPSFKKPPVTEVVLGVQFDKLQSFNSLHYGLYRERIVKRYPKYKDCSPLDSTFEFFGDKQQPFFKPQMYTIPPLRRSWYIEQEENLLIQLDPEHFFHNWRKITGDEIYPRYHDVKTEFLCLWKDYLLFCKETVSEEVKVNQWEVTYVNHIDKNKGWNNFKDLGNIFAQWSGMSTENYLPVPETLELKQTYAFTEQQGRLHVVLQPAIRRRDSKECLLLKLTARGRLDSSEVETLSDHLDMGREWIVRGFTDLTTPNAHKLWEREV
jgi:uncharacterized protein (TIGR04255 family)